MTIQNLLYIWVYTITVKLVMVEILHNKKDRIHIKQSLIVRSQIKSCSVAVCCVILPPLLYV